MRKHFIDMKHALNKLLSGPLTLSYIEIHGPRSEIEKAKDATSSMLPVYVYASEPPKVSVIALLIYMALFNYSLN